MGEGGGNPSGREPVDRLAEEFLARYRRGEWPQISEYVERHPELADEIRAVFPPLMMMERAALAGPPTPGEPDRIGPYRTIRLLGAGGQGQVFLAEDTRLKRRVALKVLAASADPQGHMLARFRREAAVTAKLDHPGICTVYEAGEDRGSFYIAMRYVEGETLAQRIAARQKGDDTTSATREGISRLVAIVERAARALHAAHEAGLVHRDIKPGNLMITPAGDPVILDFGLARDIGDEEPALTRTGMRMGTPVYMSPEQIAAERLRVDHRTDVYSLGVTLYECLTLKRPFEAATWDQLYHQILSAEPEAPRRLNPMVPPDLQIVLSTAMEKDRDRRYQTALGFAEDLRRVRELEPIRARPAGPVLRLRRWAQRNPVVAASVGAVFLALAVGLGVSARLLGETRRERDAKAEALGRAGGLGLAAHALAVVEEDPGLALSLAVEAARRAPGPQANRALVRALELNRERRRLKLGHATLPAVAFAPDGPRIAVTGFDGGLIDLEANVRIRHAPNATGFRFSPDGRRLVALGRTWRSKGGQQVWQAGSLHDGATGELLATLELPPGAEVSYAGAEAFFSPDGRRLATRGIDDVHLWDAETGRQIGRIEGAAEVAFSPDGMSALACGPEVAAIWSEGETRKVFAGSPLSGFWDDKGPRLAVAEGSEVRILDARTGTALGGLRGHEAEVARAFWSPGGARLFTTSLDGTGRLWDLARLEEIGAYDLRDLLGDRSGRDLVYTRARALWGPQATFSPDGRRIVVRDGSLRRAFLVDAVHGDVTGVLVGHQGGIASAAFGPGGTLVATASFDRTARVWDVTSPVLALRAGREPVPSVAFSPDGSRLVTADEDGVVRVWDAATGDPVASARAGAALARFSASGRRVFTVGSARDEDVEGAEIRLFDAATGEEVPVDAPAGLNDDVVYSARFVAATHVATGLSEIVVADAESGAVSARIPLDPVQDEDTFVLGFGAGDRLLLTHSPGRGLVAWDVAQGRPVSAVAIGEPPEVARLTADGRRLVADVDNGIGVWELPGGREVARLRGHADAVLSLDVGPDGRLAATASYDGTARLWDIAEGKALYAVEPGAGPLNHARISPDGRHLLTICPDGDAHLWDLATGDLVVHLAKPEGRNMFSGWYSTTDVLGDFSPDGTRVVVSSWDGLVRVWPVDALGAALATRPRELTPEERAEFLEPLHEGFHVRRAARRRVDALFNELLVREDVLERLRTERGLADDVLEAALEIAGARATDRDLAESVAWDIVEKPGRPEAEIRRARRVAEVLLRDAGEGSEVGILLALARCRLGDYEAALDALSRVEEDGTPVFLAARALAKARLGRLEEARADARSAREAGDSTYEAQALLEELDALLAAPR